MTRKFTKLMAAIALLVFMMPTMAGWGQANVHTSGDGILPTSQYMVKIGENSYTAVKFNKGDSKTITIPAGTTKLYVHAATWKGDSNSTLSFSATGVTFSSSSINLIADDNISGTTTTYELNCQNCASTSYFFELNLSGVSTETSTTVTLSAASGKRPVVWGINVVVGGSSTDPSITISGEEISNNAVSFDWNSATNNVEYTASVAYNNMDTPTSSDAVVGVYTDATCETHVSGEYFIADFDNNTETIEYAFYDDNPSVDPRTVYMRVEVFGNEDYIPCNVIAITQSGKPQYTVTYNANGATSGTAPTDSNSPYVINSNVTVLGNTGTLVKTGYTWNGWNTQADGNGTNYATGASFNITANTTLYAKWTVNTHNVTLPDADTYGSYAMNQINPVAYDTEVTLTYTPAAGYGDYTATWSVNGTALSGNKFTMPDEDVTVTVAMTNRKTATYTIASTSSVTASGTIPSNSSASFSQTYNTAGQMTKDNSMTLTLSGYQGQIIKKITLSMKSNTNGGGGYMSAKAGTTTLASIADAKFNTESWYGAWSTTYVDIIPTMSNSNYVIKSGENVEISITATTSSLYCQSFTIEYEPSTDPLVNVSPASREVDYQAHNSTSEDLNFTVSSENITGPTYTLVYCNASGTVLESNPNDWFNASLSGTSVSFTTTANTGGDRTAYFKVYATVGSEPVYSGLVSVVQKHQLATYTLVTSLEAGKRYIIASGSTGTVNVMGVKNGDVRSCVPATVSSTNQITEGDGFYEVVVSGSGTSADLWTMFDVTYGGYLCSSNGTSAYLGTKTPNDAYGQWTISINNGAAFIEANVDSDYRYLKYNPNTNSNNPRFACYKSTSANMEDVYFFKKDDDSYNYLLDIAKHTENSGWNFIASPIAEGVIANVYAGDEGTDLYYYDEPTHMWMNYRQHPNDFTFANGVGYLYANSNNVTLTFTGTSLVSDDTKVIGPLSYTPAAGNLAGWNLVGNPFTSIAYVDRSYYVIGIDDETGKNIIVASEDGAIAPCTGVMVQVESSEDNVTFTTNAPANPSNGNLQMTVAHQATTRGGASATIDNAILSFNEGSQLGKFYFGENDANLYIPQNDKEYAILSAEGQGEMPLNFRANADGQYTLTVNPEGVEMNYLHLIDNMTGNDIDLLQTPSYTFTAKTTDYESRFRLVFAANNENGVSASSTTFAYYSNGNWMVNNEGEATLQVIDVMGRVLSNQTISGTAELSLNQQPGVYVLRLVNGNDVKTQKIVVR